MRSIPQINSERSGYHRKLEEFLTKLGISFMSEQIFHPYKVDILLPEFWVAIEVDGPSHNIRISKDLERDRHLLQMYQLPVLRIKTKTKINSLRLENLILDFIEQYAEDAEVRKVNWRNLMP